MNQTDTQNPIKELPGTNILISGREVLDLSLPKNIELIKQKKVQTVFMIYYGADLRGDYQLEHQAAAEQILKEGIQFIPITKNPHDIGTFELTHAHLNRIHKNNRALLMCYHGAHNSAAYAAYHLLRKGYGLGRVHLLLRDAGWSDGEVSHVRHILDVALKSKGYDAQTFGKAQELLMLRRQERIGSKKVLEAEIELKGITKRRPIVFRGGKKKG